jgi:hypothetical protein
LNKNQEYSFGWWKGYAWLILIVGNLFIFGQIANLAYSLNPDADRDRIILVSLLLIIPNSILGVMILKFNKYAFLISTILSINPIIWIVNGIYLKNRWSHPSVNNTSNTFVDANKIFDKSDNGKN